MTETTSLITTDVVVPTGDGDPMRAYVAHPSGPGLWTPAIVLGELFGLTDVQRSAADRVAAMGYVAIAPDLLHRHVPDGPLPEDDDGRRRGLELAHCLTRDELLGDVQDALACVRREPACHLDDAPVAVGMSYGGHVAFLAAARLGLPACAVLYAGWLAGTDIAASRPEPTGTLMAPLAEAGTRLLILAGEDDPLVPPGDLAALRRWAAEAGAELEMVTYAGAGHRFCSEGRPGYDAEVADDAWARVARHLDQARR